MVAGSSIENVTGQTRQSPVPTALIDDATAFYFQLVVRFGLGFILAVFGITANTVNLVVFYKQASQDNIAASFFALAVSDLCCLLCFLCSTVSIGVAQLLPDLDVDGQSVHFIAFAFQRTMFNDISMYITMYISATRCLSAVKPFQFKRFVTRKTSIIFVVSCFLATAIFYIPVHATQGLSWQHDARLNKTRLLFWVEKKRVNSGMGKIYNIFVTLILNSFATLTIMLTTARLAMVVIKSSQFRAKSKERSLDTHRSIHSGRVQQVKTPSSSGIKEMSTQEANSVIQRNLSVRISSKELTTVKLVTAICCIFIITNIPNTIGTLFVRFVPEFRAYGRYRHIFNISSTLTGVFNVLGASANIFFYHKLSSSYRATITKLLLKAGTAP